MPSFLKFLLLAVAMSFVASGRAQTPDPFVAGQAVVVKIQGNASATDAETQVAIPLKAGSLLTARQTVKTEAGAYAIVALSNGAVLRIGESTTLSLTEYKLISPATSYDFANEISEPSASQTKIKVSRGEVLLKIKKLRFDQGSQFNVETPVGTAGVRGTTYKVSFKPEERSADYRVALLEGVVNFRAFTSSLSSLNVNGGKQLVLENLLLKPDGSGFDNWPGKLVATDIPPLELANLSSEASELIASVNGLKLSLNGNQQGPQQVFFEASPSATGLNFLRHPSPPVLPPLPDVSPVGGE